MRPAFHSHCLNNANIWQEFCLKNKTKQKTWSLYKTKKEGRIQDEVLTKGLNSRKQAKIPIPKKIDGKA